MIDITNVVNISVSAPPAGIAPYNLNNLACFTKDEPVNPDLDVFTVYSNPTDVLADWGSESSVYQAAVSIFSQAPNILTGGGRFIVIAMVGDETLEEALGRVKDLVYFGGFSYTFPADAEEVTDAATAAKAMRRMIFVISSTQSDLEDGGLLFSFQAATLTNARGLFYSVGADAAKYLWAYASRGMSTNFSGSNTTQTMHLKQLSGIEPDPAVSATVLMSAQTCGADVYVNIAGRPSLMTAGSNGFFDDIYNLNWFLGALEVAGFNALAQAGTKIPQTEEGVSVLKSAYQSVCEQGLSNRFIGPGKWTSPDTFGDPQTFLRSISESGYYIYSLPVVQQLTADREQRKCPVAQIGIKYSGALHSSDVIVYVNR